MSSSRCDCIWEYVKLDVGFELRLVLPDPDCRATHVRVAS